MATVTKNPDDTYTVTLTAKEQKTLKRHGEFLGASKAKALEGRLTDQLDHWREEYRRTDGTTKQDKYDSLDATVQAQIDALLG